LLYLFFGQDDFSLRAELEKLKGELGSREELVANTTLLDARQLSLNNLINTCNAAPFLGQKRLVIVEGLLGRFEPRKGGDKARPAKSESESWHPFADYIYQLPTTTVLVLVDGKVGSDNPLLKKLAPKAIVKAFPPLWGAGLVRWISSRVAQQGGSISPQAAKLLAEFAGENLGVLANEIEKLLLYTSGRCIERNDVERVTSYAREANVFALVDAISERCAPKSRQQLHQLLARGVAPSFLLVMLTRQFRLIMQAKELSDLRLSTPQIQERLNLSPNYPLAKLVKQAGNFSWAQLIESYQWLLETDLAIKTGKWGSELALDLLATELCANN